MANIFEEKLKKVLDEEIESGNLFFAKRILKMCEDTFSESEKYALKILKKEVEIEDKL